MTKVSICAVYVFTCTDFFGHECSENAEEKCSEFRAAVPLSKQFNSTAFDQYCRYVIFGFSDY